MTKREEIEAAGHADFMLGCAERLRVMLADPFVGNAFPFVKRRDVADSCQSRLCRIFSKSGLQLAKGKERRWLVTPEGHGAGNPMILRGRKFYSGQPINPKWIDDMSPDELAPFGDRSGSQYFWRFDPLWATLFEPPSHSGCRCCAGATSVEGAAHAGVIIAQQWLETGVKPPDKMLCVPRPRVRLSRKWLAYRKAHAKPGAP
jgi:hypothetical protein